MGIFYKSERIGKNGKPFVMWKIKTLKDGSDKSQFAKEYTFLGKFLRRFKIDEFPQVWNIVKGDMSIVGPRPEEKRTIDSIPIEIRNTILSVKPGLTDLSSVYFFDEGKFLEQSKDPYKDFWTKIKPMKMMLQIYYVKNKCLLLDIAIVYMTIKRIIIEMFNHEKVR